MSLHRVSEGRMLAGVCTGLSAELNIDVTIVRIMFALVSVFLGGGVIAYIVLWVLMPNDDGHSVALDGASKVRRWYRDRNDRP